MKVNDILNMLAIVSTPVKVAGDQKDSTVAIMFEPKATRLHVSVTSDGSPKTIVLSGDNVTRFLSHVDIISTLADKIAKEKIREANRKPRKPRK